MSKLNAYIEAGYMPRKSLIQFSELELDFLICIHLKAKASVNRLIKIYGRENVRGKRDQKVRAIKLADSSQNDLFQLLNESAMLL